MDYRFGFVACFIVGALNAQELCYAFGNNPPEDVSNRSETNWKYVHSVVHIHYPDAASLANIEPTIVYDAISSVNEEFASAEVSVSLVALEYHEIPDLDSTVCFPYNINAMQAYIAPLQWDIASYMNIHVFPEFCGGILGFAYLYYLSSQYADGVYVRSDCFGRMGNHLLEDRNLNKTLIHEVGHYVGLYHVFQGIDYCGEEESDCQAVNDRVCDTPPTKVNWSCENPICPTGAYNYETNNHMDYYVDSCRTTFTYGQIERIHNTLPSWRPDVLQENVYCIGDVNNDLNVGIQDLLILFSHFGKSYDGQADINKDGIISVHDLNEIFSNWSSSCQ